MKILLTGASGFIGSAFARLATNRGHQVAGLLVPGETPPADLAGHEMMNWMRGTLEEAPWEAIRMFSPELCVHAAWITTPGVYLESPENYRFRDASLRFLRQVAEAGASHVIGLGTCIEYEIKREPLSEVATPIAPSTTYARCKNEVRLALEWESQSRGFGFGWARVFYPYGPREHPSRLCSSIVEKLSRGERITLKTPNSTKDYIYIEDLAAALLKVVEHRYRGAINLGTGSGVAVKAIARTLGRLLGREELIEEAPAPAVDPFDQVIADASRLRGLGWQPGHDLDTGLRSLVEWWQGNRGRG